MVENIPGQVPVSRGAAPGKQAASIGAGAAAGGAAFHALLEKLESNARELELQSRSIQNPKELTGAVDRAHASLQDVLTLGDRLLEAYREALARQQAAGRPAGAPAPGAKP
jgi:hypothetical protein